MELKKSKNIGVVQIRHYEDPQSDVHLMEMESQRIGFQLGLQISKDDGYVDEEYLKELWFKLKFWAHVMDTFRWRWMIYVVRRFF